MAASAVTPVVASAPRVASQPNDNERVKESVEAPSPYIPVAVALIGVGGVYLNHRWAKRREAVARFSVAAKDFRAAMAPELTVLQSGRELHEDLSFFLLRAFEDRHSAAYIAFEAAAPRAKLAALRTAWHKYHSGHEEYGEEDGIVPGGGAPEPYSKFCEYSWHFVGRSESPYQLAAKRLEAVLMFAHAE